MTRPKVGFLGVGWIGRHRMAAMLATGAVDAAMLYDPAPECLAEARALAPGAAVAATPEALLGAGLDGVVIASPSALHAAQAVRALDGGAAVFCQKPLGRTGDEVAGVIAAARRADRLLGADFSYRATAAMRAIANRLRDGAIGPVFAADLVFHNAYGPDKPWFYDRAQAGGGCMMDLGIHLIDLTLWALDFPEVTDVDAQSFADGERWRAGDPRVEDYATATLTLASGASVRLACSWRLHAGTDAVIAAEFHGRDGGLAMRNVAGSFYDLEAHTHHGTARAPLAGPPDDWGGRAAAGWAEALARSRAFDPAAERFVDSARVLDRIYAGA